MRHVFLINPHAGKQDQTARIRALADRLAAAHNLDCRCLLTDRPGGEDLRSAGTGNDFLKNFGPDAAKFSDPEHLWDGPEFPLDLIDCNGRLRH